MSKIGKIARRSFLIGSVAVAGGVAFGVYQVKKPAPNPLTSSAGEAVLNPFVVINKDGVTLIAPKAEMGRSRVHICASGGTAGFGPRSTLRRTCCWR